jgi:hypothetical protein
VALSTGYTLLEPTYRRCACADDEYGELDHQPP